MFLGLQIPSLCIYFIGQKCPHGFQTLSVFLSFLLLSSIFCPFVFYLSSKRRHQASSERLSNYTFICRKYVLSKVWFIVNLSCQKSWCDVFSNIGGAPTSFTPRNQMRGRLREGGGGMVGDGRWGGGNIAIMGRQRRQCDGEMACEAWMSCHAGKCCQERKRGQPRTFQQSSDLKQKVKWKLERVR